MRFLVPFTLLITSLVFFAHAATLPHQGRILISGSAYEGTGLFRFALVNQSGSIVWNHEGGVGDPQNSLSIPVKKGFYQCRLGDTSINGMAELPDTIFTLDNPLKLRIWFDDGTNGLQRLGNDQNLMTAPYSMTSSKTESEKIASRFADEIIRQANAGNISVDELIGRISLLAQQATQQGTITEEMLPASILSDLNTSLSLSNEILQNYQNKEENNFPDSAEDNSTLFPSEVLSKKRSFIFAREPQTFEEFFLPTPSNNVGREIVFSSTIDFLIISHAKKLEGDKNMLLLRGQHANPVTVTVVSDGFQWRTVGDFFYGQYGNNFFNSDPLVNVIDIKIGTEGSHPSVFYVFEDKLFFSADTEEFGRELWITDGSKDGTQIVQDLFIGESGSYPRNFTQYQGELYFQVESNGWWKTDGSAEGTTEIEDNSTIQALSSNILTGYFNKDGSLWKRDSNGLEVLVSTRVQGNNFFEFNGETYFAGIDSNGTELWKTNGTDATTMLVKDLYPGITEGAYYYPFYQEYSYVNSGNPGDFFVLDNQFYFSATNEFGTELWKSDGTEQGTNMIKDIYPGSISDSLTMNVTINSSSPRDFIVIGDTLHFLANDLNGTSLWETNGEENGTVPSTIIPVGEIGGSFKILGSHLIYTSHSNASPYGSELHIRDISNLQDSSSEPAQPTTHTVDLNSSVNLEMIWVEPGTFTMGSPTTEHNHQPYEVEHNVTITEGYYLGKYEVTQAQYEAVMKGNTAGLSATPSYFNDKDRPVERVSWDNIQIFLQRLNDAERNAGRLQSGWEYALPTEAEWEYACRAGTKTMFSFGDYTSNNPSLANFNPEPLETTVVGSYGANPWGFYDMHGNVFEFCADYYGDYSLDETIDPVGPDSGTMRVVRGGGWNTSLSWGRSASRNGRLPDIESDKDFGFRIAFKKVEIAQPTIHTVDLNSSVSLEMIWVEPGTFTIGSPVTEEGRRSDETEHNVTLTEGFYLGKYEVTQAQYEVVMTGNTDGLNARPSTGDDNSNRPVDHVSWDDAQVFLTRLNDLQISNLPNGWKYVLPTEAQWEYACRAGTTTAYSWGDTINFSNAKYDSGYSVTVGQYAANPWGFFDMHGNVSEWVSDFSVSYPEGDLIDPKGPAIGLYRGLRGGSLGYTSLPEYLRSAMRSRAESSRRERGIGFRISLQKQ